MWSLGFLLVFGKIFLSQESNGYLLPEKRAAGPCGELSPQFQLVAVPNRRFNMNGRNYLSTIQVIIPNIEDQFSENSLGVPSLDRGDPLHQINIPNWDRGDLKHETIIPGYGNVMKFQVSQPKSVKKIVYRIPGNPTFLPYPSLNAPKPEETESDDEKSEYTDIFDEIESQEFKEARRAEEAMMEEDTNTAEVRKLEEAEEPKSSVPESESPENRMQYPVHHNRNANKNVNINSNINSHRHKWGK